MNLLLENGASLLLEDGTHLLTEAYESTSRKQPLIWLYSLTGERQLPIHDLGDVIVEDRLGDLELLTFTLRADDPKAFAVAADALVEFNERFYRVQQLHQFRAGAQTMIEVVCEARWLDLVNYSPGGTFSVLAQTALAGLSSILAGTNWTAAVKPDDDAVYSLEAIDTTALALVRQWAAIVGREIAWDTVSRIVTLVPTVGENRGIGFRWGHNLRAVSRKESPPIATRLYPFGANDLDVSNVNPTTKTYIEDYSWYISQGLTLAEASAQFRKDQVWNDQRYLVALNLFDAAVRRLSALAQPTISYELSVADFASLTATTADDVNIGDVVRVTDAAFNLDLTTRVVRLVQHPLKPQSNAIELSYLQPGLGAAASQTNGTARTIDYAKLSTFVDSNAFAVMIADAVTPFASISISSTGESTIILGATLKGTAIGAGTIRFSVAINGVDLVPTYDFVFVDAQAVEFSWPTFATGVDTASTALITWRGRVVSGDGTILIAPNEGRGWLLVAGAIGSGVSTMPDRQIEGTLIGFSVALVDTATSALFAAVAVALGADSVAAELSTITDAAVITFI